MGSAITSPGLDWGNIGLMGLGGAAGAIPKSGTSTTSSTGSGSSQTQSQMDLKTFLDAISNLHSTSTSTTTPTMSPEATSFMNNLISKMSNQGNVNLRPYEASQAEAIDRSSNVQQQAIANTMASRGLSTSPAAATSDANIQAQRFGSLTNLHQQIPLLQEQIQQQRNAQMAQLLSILPRGSTTTGAQDQTGETKQTGTSSQTGTSNTNYQNQQDSTTKTKSGGGWGGALGGLASVAAALML
jgi:hypothetical protein